MFQFSSQPHRKLHIGVVSSLKHPAMPPFKGGTEATAWATASLFRQFGHPVTLFQTGDVAPPGVTNVPLPVASTAADDYEHRLAGAVLKYCDELDPSIDVLINLSWIDSFPALNMAGYGPPQVFWLMLPFHNAPTFDYALARYYDWTTARFIPVLQTHAQAAPYIDFGLHPPTTYIPVPAQEQVVNGAYCTAPNLEEPYLVWAGRPDSSKGLDRAMRIAEAANKPLLAFATEDNELVQALRDRQQANVAISVGVAPHKIYEAIAKAVAVLCPNRLYTATNRVRESGSRVAIDALLCGTPVVATDDGCFRDWLTTNCNGALVPPPDETFSEDKYIQECAESVEDLFWLQVNEPSFRKAIRKNAVECFSHERIYNDLLHVIRVIMPINETRHAQ